MNFDILKNNILAIKNSLINEGKIYQHTLSGKVFSSYNFQLPVLHKKRIKIISWKELGDKMQVFFSQPYTHTPQLDNISFCFAFSLFTDFDENSGKKYSFLYKIQKQHIQTINPLLKNFPMLLSSLHPYADTMLLNTVFNKPHSLDALSLLFGLFVLYGKFQTKNSTILGAKITLPVFGQYTGIIDFYQNIFNLLSDQGYFMKYNIQQGGETTPLQVSITDSNLLIIFTEWYQSIEKFSEIIRVSDLVRAKILLVDFIKAKNSILNTALVENLKLISK